MQETDSFKEPFDSLPRLLAGEKRLRVEDIELYVPTQPPSSLRELQRLAQVKAEGEVGSFGPSLAAIALERPNESISPELRKYEALFGRDSLRVALDVLPAHAHELLDERQLDLVQFVERLNRRRANHRSATTAGCELRPS